VPETDLALADLRAGGAVMAAPQWWAERHGAVAARFPAAEADPTPPAKAAPPPAPPVERPPLRLITNESNVRAAWERRKHGIA
jgi:hypothetical protein